MRMRTWGRNTERFDLIWSKLPDMTKLNIEDMWMQLINQRYKVLIKFKNNYIELLQQEVAKREIKKKEKFQNSNLNIKLSKFCGYGSTTDIYTFQSEFEEIYLQSTPSNLLPDLLKNNLLADPALTLVKSVDNIDEIWKRLKQAYGSSKILLHKKLGELGTLASVNRNKSTEKMEFSISKIITTMKDLVKLAKAHDIEAMLYNGDGLDRVLKLLGEGRVTRWLSKLYDDENDVMLTQMKNLGLI